MLIQIGFPNEGGGCAPRNGMGVTFASRLYRCSDSLTLADLSLQIRSWMGALAEILARIQKDSCRRGRFRNRF
jgi:hypothetical protein